MNNVPIINKYYKVVAGKWKGNMFKVLDIGTKCIVLDRIIHCTHLKHMESAVTLHNSKYSHLVQITKKDMPTGNEYYSEQTNRHTLG